jgi:hypothetical protein
MRLASLQISSSKQRCSFIAWSSPRLTSCIDSRQAIIVVIVIVIFVEIFSGLGVS